MICPATMCPLFAPEGSPWTGEKNALCPEHTRLNEGGCPWWGMGCAEGGPYSQIHEADCDESGKAVVIGPSRPRRERAQPRFFDCPRASECSWQRNAGEKLCPPRLALSLGLDPRNAAF